MNHDMNQKEWQYYLKKNVTVYDGVQPSSFPLVCLKAYQTFLTNQAHTKDRSNVVYIILSRDDDVFSFTEQLRALQPDQKILPFPAWDCLPYDRASPSSSITHCRLDTLYQLCTYQKSVDTKIDPIYLVTSVAALGQYLPMPSVLSSDHLTLSIGDTIRRKDLMDILQAKGCTRVDTVYEVGEYAVRGSLIDIFPPDAKQPLRLDFFDDTLESVRAFDPLTQKTEVLSTKAHQETIQSFSIRPVHEILLSTHTITQFKAQYRKRFGKSRDFPNDDPFYLSISDGHPYPGMEHWMPLFFDHMATLIDYARPSLVIGQEGIEQSIVSRMDAVHDYYTMRLDPPYKEGPLYHPIEPELLYWDDKQWHSFFKSVPIAMTSSFKVPNGCGTFATKMAPSFKEARESSIENLWDALAKYLDQFPYHHKFLCCQSEGSKDRFVKLLSDHDFKIPLCVQDHFSDDDLNDCALKKNVLPLSILVWPLEKGFESSHGIFLSESDILGESMRKAKPKKQKAHAFFQDLTQFTVGDIIVHRDKGIGRYLGLKAVEVDRCPHDCLCLEYDDGDKLFLPVENIELISRYGDADSLITLDKLGGSGWNNRKARAKKRIQVVADYLIQLAVSRSLKKGSILNPYLQQDDHQIHVHGFDDFCARFVHTETDDQLQAIQDVIDDLVSGRPMDRLICGDVGFGKTEVALRAAFIAVMNQKQVVLVVPTTLLCRQHFETFSKRFKGFPFNVKQISRLVSPKETRQIMDGLADGTVHIVIATHGILSEKVKLHDLGLVIVDEEQHFGVKHKERLKTLKNDVHILTLTATPIPRTLQLSLTGVRDLSLITTPPVDRLAVRTFVMPKDDMVIRDAILREYHRGGQVFYVTPRLDDLPALEKELKELVPMVKVGIAHGQLSATALEEVMTAFYDRQFDVLLSTHIVESGIDVPNANTLIIHKCDLFGLSQLYQLRGRVGRAKTQGYAYFTYPAALSLSDNAMKRLHVIQSLDTLGAGFMLASHDLDIRGAGNIVGEEQSGHMREVGVELYQTLLQEAIIMAKAEEANREDHAFLDMEVNDWTPQIQLGVPVLIPEVYVSDLGLRLTLYRRLSHLKTRESIDQFAAELVDRFGKIPPEVHNLLDVVELKNYCRHAFIAKLDAGPRGVLISFHNDVCPYIDRLMLFLQRPEVAKQGIIKIRPDQKIFFARDFLDPTLRRRGTIQLLKALSSVAMTST